MSVEVFISFLIVIAVFVWIMVLHDRTVREMMAVLERQTRCLERLAAIPDDNDPERKPASVIPFPMPFKSPIHGMSGWTMRPPDGQATTTGRLK